MGAANVWNCICSYRGSSAKTLLKKYGSANNIINTLNSYPGKDLYHGHKKGKKGSNTNPGADGNLDNAITYLNQNIPIAPIISLFDYNNNNNNNNNNVKPKKQMLNLVQAAGEGTNFGTLSTQLKSIDENWMSNKKLVKKYNEAKMRKINAKKNKKK